MNKSEEGVNKITEIQFLDIKVPVYHDRYNDNEDSMVCVWQMRNPDSCYVGYMYMNNETDKITYPDDAVIPEQTDKDREMLPKFIAVSKENLTEAMIVSINEYLNKEYKRRNNK